MGLTYNGVEPETITYDGHEVESVTYNGVEVWSSTVEKPWIKINADLSTAVGDRGLDLIAFNNELYFGYLKNVDTPSQHLDLIVKKVNIETGEVTTLFQVNALTPYKNYARGKFYIVGGRLVYLYCDNYFSGNKYYTVVENNPTIIHQPFTDITGVNDIPVPPNEDTTAHVFYDEDNNLNSYLSQFVSGVSEYQTFLYKLYFENGVLKSSITTLEPKPDYIPSSCHSNALKNNNLWYTSKYNTKAEVINKDTYLWDDINITLKIGDRELPIQHQFYKISKNVDASNIYYIPMIDPTNNPKIYMFKLTQAILERAKTQNVIIKPVTPQNTDITSDSIFKSAAHSIYKINNQQIVIFDNDHLYKVDLP